jgi:hypothetical protein
MKRLAFLFLSLAGCATEGDPCGAAAAHIAACFPDHAIVAPSCDADSADDIASASCDELAMRDGKADGWSCVWMPWLPSCGGGGGSSSSGKKIEVAVEECGPGPLCPYVQSAPCGLVTLHKGSAEVARGYSSGGGRLTFEGLAAGEYTVKVHHRDNSLAKMLPDQLSDAQAPASSKFTVGSGETPWARFELVNGSAEKLTRCAQSRGNLTVKDRAGHAVDRALVEWDWIVEHEVDGAIERTRPLYFSDLGGENVIGFRMLRAGTHKLRFVRVNIPSYLQRPNPDYDRLRRDYAANVAPIETTFSVSASQIGGTVSINRTITDPLR